MVGRIVSLALVAMALGACAPGGQEPAPNAATMPVEAAVTSVPPPPQGDMPMPTAPVTATTPVPPAHASIAGAIRDGNRPPPALRVCASPVDGGAGTCIDTAPGARAYRIDVAPGRYYLFGWVVAGDATLIAHAAQIRCIRAPCPPDELIEVEVGAGEAREGIDLNGSYVDIPAGWPQRPG